MAAPAASPSRRPTQSEPAASLPAAQMPSAQRTPNAVKQTSTATTRLAAANPRPPSLGSNQRHCRSPTAPPRPARNGQASGDSGGRTERNAVSARSASGRLKIGSQGQARGRPSTSRTPQLMDTSTGSQAARPNS